MTEQEMPRYQCHKKVRALKIGSIEHKPNPDQSVDLPLYFQTPVIT